MKAGEIGALRAHTLTREPGGARGRSGDAARAPRRGRHAVRVRQRRLGDRRDGSRGRPPCRAAGWPGSRCLDLTDDPAILTALANDIGPGALYTRQLIAFGKPRDVAVAFSTSGGSANIVEALAEARRRGLATIAFVGYDGGRIAAEQLADHVIVVASEHIPRIQEAQASAYHVLRELVA